MSARWQPPRSEWAPLRLSGFGGPLVQSPEQARRATLTPTPAKLERARQHRIRVAAQDQLARMGVFDPFDDVTLTFDGQRDEHPNPLSAAIAAATYDTRGHVVRVSLTRETTQTTGWVGVLVRDWASLEDPWSIRATVTRTIMGAEDGSVWALWEVSRLLAVEWAAERGAALAARLTRTTHVNDPRGRGTVPVTAVPIAGTGGAEGAAWVFHEHGRPPLRPAELYALASPTSRPAVCARSAA